MEKQKKNYHFLILEVKKEKKKKKLTKKLSAYSNKSCPSISMSVHNYSNDFSNKKKKRTAQ